MPPPRNFVSFTFVDAAVPENAVSEDLAQAILDFENIENLNVLVVTEAEIVPS